MQSFYSFPCHIIKKARTKKKMLRYYFVMMKLWSYDLMCMRGRRIPAIIMCALDRVGNISINVQRCHQNMRPRLAYWVLPETFSRWTLPMGWWYVPGVYSIDPCSAFDSYEFDWSTASSIMNMFFLKAMFCGSRQEADSAVTQGKTALYDTLVL